MTPDPGPDEGSYDAVIVGGGAAGVLVAIRLLMRGATAPRIAIVEPDAELARGAAYATGQPAHLLNVVASRMSAIAEQPGHFLQFLERDGAGAAAGLCARFMPRRDYARYLRDTLASLPGSAAVAHLRAPATDIERFEGGYRVQLGNGGSISAAHVVLAIGNAPRPLPAYLLHAGVCVAEAWSDGDVAAIPAAADVCILGSGLSMVDAVLTLAAGGHRGRILVLSRHGLAPLPHVAPGPHDDPGVEDLLPLGVLARWRLLRRRIGAAVAAGEPWQWSLDRLRPHGQRLWRSLDAVERRRFLRHAVRYWDIHRHRIAPEAAAALDALRAEGRLEIVAGRLRAITADPAGGSCIHYRPRHHAREHMRHADWIVNATGVETNVDLHPGGLLQALRARGIVLPGPLGIGLASTVDGHVIDARGRPDPRLFVIGALRIGELWESIAIPELREQARDIAATILPDRARPAGRQS
ncbi:FAD/NAD(P)-binding protein [Luteimonas kalidii]|uniref:FAD/NAD(P)-binding protein n=1 Tax=Luteimonas kalidii TaxID=3042025 RepID=A0ABT6JZI6_9GAMM|nr:FAD/NAD(P)-binding protein [Luteimonas kalidii]MDH5835611.1 FAD/NAD(P)-binding protein [Luteimonas kalidii]